MVSLFPLRFNPGQGFQRRAAKPSFTPTPLPLDFLSFSGQRALPLAKKSIVICTDVDDTLINWEKRTNRGLPVGLSPTLRFLKHQRPYVHTVFNTGRGLISFRETLEAVKKGPLDDFVLDALIVNNGQRIFKNPLQLPLKAWVSTLQIADQDPQWEHAQEALTGWNFQIFRNTLETALTEQGFKQQPSTAKNGHSLRTTYRLPGTPVVIDLYPDQGAFRMKVFSDTPNPQMIQAGERLAASVLKSLQAKGWAVEVKQAIFDHLGAHSAKDVSPAYTEMIHVFNPQGVHKATALQYLLREMDGITAVIPAGDSPNNDTELLLHPYQSKEGKPLMVLPVISGRNLNLIRLISKVVDTVFVPKGQLAPGFKEQFQKIRDTLQQNLFPIA